MSPICGICSQICVEVETDSYVKCAGKCEKPFHVRCIKDDFLGKKTRSARDWKCKECRSSSSMHSSAITTTSTAITKDFLVRVLEDFKSEIFNELKNFKKEMTDLSTAVSFVSDKLDASTQIMKEMRTELAAIQKENEDLRRKNADLTYEVNLLKNKVRLCEQYSRKDNIEISGLPVTQNEDVISVVKDVGAAVGVKVLESDISTTHRVPSYSKNRTPSLIVKFVRRSTRDSLITRFREKKGGITARDVNSTFPQQRIYVNEHLHPDDKVFLAKIKAKCKEIGYSYSWCRDGKFFVRKCQGESCKRVDTYEDLDKLK